MAVPDTIRDDRPAESPAGDHGDAKRIDRTEETDKTYSSCARGARAADMSSAPYGRKPVRALSLSSILLV